MTLESSFFFQRSLRRETCPFLFPGIDFSSYDSFSYSPSRIACRMSGRCTTFLCFLQLLERRPMTPRALGFESYLPMTLGLALNFEGYPPMTLGQTSHPGTQLASILSSLWRLKISSRPLILLQSRSLSRCSEGPSITKLFGCLSCLLQSLHLLFFKTAQAVP